MASADAAPQPCSPLAPRTPRLLPCQVLLPCISRQKPDNTKAHPGRTAERALETRPASLPEILLAEQKKNEIKLNCRAGVFRKGWESAVLSLRH